MQFIIQEGELPFQVEEYRGSLVVEERLDLTAPPHPKKVFQRQNASSSDPTGEEATCCC